MRFAATNIRSALLRAVCGLVLLGLVAEFTAGCSSCRVHPYVYGRKPRAIGAPEDPNNIYNRPEHQVGVSVTIPIKPGKTEATAKDPPPDLPMDQLMKEKDIQ